MYGYVGGDPINGWDTLGLCGWGVNGSFAPDTSKMDYVGTAKVMGTVAGSLTGIGLIRTLAIGYPGIYIWGTVALDETGIIGVSLTGIVGQQLSKAERLGLINQILAKLNPKNADEALGQLGRVMEAVEDACSGVAKNPNPGLKPDGRMYPPQADKIIRNADGSLDFITRGHDGHITSDGEIITTPRF